MDFDKIEMGEDIDPEMQKLVEGLDSEDENFGLKVMERDLAPKMVLLSQA